MASKEQKKLQKKKKREKENRQQTLRRREELRAPAREERAQRKADKRIDKLQKELSDYQTFSADAWKDMDEEKMLQLEKNVQILRGLEDEWQEEVNKKASLNKELESQGHGTLDEKLRAVSQQTIEQQKAEVGMSGSADCRMGLSPKPRTGAGLGTKGGDYAEVSVTKAEPKTPEIKPDDEEKS
tara:strand:- start:931 stop:1482 length:552 start_codon:yes stop_codon:yes gene_type:complete